MNLGPQRIVCLTEEPTEWLYLLGEERRIVGISGYTVRPPQARVEKPKVSAFLSAKIDKIVELMPDCVIGFSDLQSPRDLTTGNLLALRARQSGTPEADSHVAAWNVGAEAQLSGYRYDDAANKERSGGYTLINLYASTPLSKNWTLLARVNNLANKNYQVANAYTTLGRTFYTTVRWAPQ